MNAEFNTNKFHEREDFLVQLVSPADRNRVAAHLEAADFVVDHEGDFAYLERDASNTPWQSSDVTQVDFLLSGRPSNHPEPIDSFNFMYLLATLPEDTIPIFVSVVKNCMMEFDGQLRHRGMPLDQSQLTDILGQYVDDLRTELADQPGTDFVARMVYEFTLRGEQTDGREPE